MGQLGAPVDELVLVAQSRRERDELNLVAAQTLGARSRRVELQPQDYTSGPDPQDQDLRTRTRPSGPGPDPLDQNLRTRSSGQGSQDPLLHRLHTSDKHEVEQNGGAG